MDNTKMKYVSANRMVEDGRVKNYDVSLGGRIGLVSFERLCK